MSALRAARVGLPLVVIVAGVWLRWHHLGTTSLWWDEVVEISTAELPDVGAVVRQVRAGIPPGRGNAGAMPLDYVMLHGWLALAPRVPAPFLEVQHRFPAFVWASATLVAICACGWWLFGWGVGVLAAALLGLVIPHVLYAAEVRPYALMGLLSTLNLTAFGGLVRRPERAASWLVWGASALAFLASGLLAVIPLAAQLAVLGVTLVRRLGERAVALTLGSTAVVVAAVAVWYAGVDVVAPHGRGRLDASAPWRETLAALEFFVSGDRVLAAVLLLSLPAPIVWARRHERALLPVAVLLSSGVLVLPVVVGIEAFKDYYFHPRHVLFVLPYLVLVAATGVDAASRGLDPLRFLVRDRAWREVCTVGIALVILVGVHAPVVARYLRTPEVFFARTKTLRDFKPLVQALRAALPPAGSGARFVLVAERNRAGHLANPVLRRYLRWWGIESRVALHGTGQVPATLAALGRACPDGCVGRPVDALVRALGVGAAVDSPVRFRGLLGFVRPDDVGGGKVGGVGLLVYGPQRTRRRVLAPPGWRRSSYTGIALLEPPGSQPQGREARVVQ